MRRSTSVSPTTAQLVGPGKLRVLNDRLTFTAPNTPPLYLALESLRHVSCFGDVSLNAGAMELLLAHDVDVALLTPEGYRCRGRLVGSRDSSTVLRMLQHACHRDAHRQRELARRTVLAKIASQRESARYFQRHGVQAAGQTLRRLDSHSQQAQQASSLDALRGCEGAASATWFTLFGDLVESPWQFTTRTHRPPRDPVNALLSLGYTWLLNRVVAKLQGMGFEVNVGFLHEFHPGRPSLACDVMEPFRVPAVDRWVLQFCNRGQLDPAAFRPQADGGVYLPQDAFGPTIASWQRYWHDGRFDSVLDRTAAELEREIRKPA